MSLLALAMPHHIPAGQDPASCILRAPSPPRSLVHGEEGAGAADKPPQAMNQSCCLPRAKRLSPMAIYSCERAAARQQVSGIAESLMTSYQKQPCSEGWQDDSLTAGLHCNTVTPLHRQHRELSLLLG